MSQRILDTGNTIMVDRPSNKVPSNFFDLSHDHKTSCNAGLLVPVLCMECVPGDKVSFSMEALVRFQPMLAPMMYRVNVRAEAFFVPNRLLWPNWEKFISPLDAGASFPPAAPVFKDFTVNTNDLANYLGLPRTDWTLDPLPTIDQASALPHAAYQKIYSDWYRDEDLNPDAEFVPLVDDTNNIADYSTLQVRNWDRDYFTSAKPWAQKGPSVVIPGSASGSFQDVPVAYVGGNQPQLVLDQVTGLPITQDLALGVNGLTETNLNVNNGSTHQSANIDLGNTHVAMTSTLNPIDSNGTINDLRKAEALQTFLEADSRGGTRYIETIRQHFGVHSSDSRLQRAEYIGSTYQPLTISEVLQTSESSTTAQGNMAGHGISAGHSDHCRYSCEEHGFIMIIMSVLPVTGYSQGMPKMWLRNDRLDYLWPEFALLGEQEVLNRELMYNDNGDFDDQVFGYVPRYSEYRYLSNRISGDFQTSLNYWHWSRLFPPTTVPALNQSFLGCTPGERIFAVTDDSVQHILCHWFFKIKMLRKLPRYVKPNI